MVAVVAVARNLSQHEARAAFPSSLSGTRTRSHRSPLTLSFHGDHAEMVFAWREISPSSADRPRENPGCRAALFAGGFAVQKSSADGQFE